MPQESILRFLQKPKSTTSGSSRPGQPYHRRPDPNSTRHDNSHSESSRPLHRQHRGPNNRRNADLKKIADETKEELPKILHNLPSFDATESFLVDLEDLSSLDPDECPGFTLPSDDDFAGERGTRIRIYDMDTLDCALQLSPSYKVHTHLRLPNPHSSSPSHPAPTTQSPENPVAVLNLASERSPGGGWSNGALAQEECLCYRSSLSLSLHRSHYPIPSLSAIYTPSVLLLRTAMSAGHILLTPATPPLDLPVVSIISIAALRKPALTDDGKAFKHEGQRAETKRKIRLTLRIAAHRGHTKLCLGALGCGVFANPPREVAACFLEVMREKEFSGGWWEDVAFAVLDNIKGEDGGKDGEGNFGVFYRALDGQVV